MGCRYNVITFCMCALFCLPFIHKHNVKSNLCADDEVMIEYIFSILKRSYKVRKAPCNVA